jgi:tetratricopeptide (TPR) repeat protein
LREAVTDSLIMTNEMNGEGKPEEKWDAISRLVDEGLQLAPELRKRYVEENTTDPEVSREVLELLEATTGEEGFLETPAGLEATALGDPLLDFEAGNCRLVRLLGEGGMGRVYEAVRRLEMPGESQGRPAPEQRVAVKIWHRGIIHAGEMRREAALLARLEHPGIARLLDTGQLANGQPFLVMELVEGEPLEAYARGKTQAEKLRLLQEICEAIEAAHRALIAHRDIKPSNILVNAEGKPKLIDFGISKPVDDGAQTVDTRLTPRYASPEQLRGEVIRTSTDIYSLGVVMYEVLTGKNPFAGKSGTALALAICEERVAAPDLPVDLASIVLKAMAQKQAERYPSALALNEDIGRYLRNEPVRAMEATYLYRTGKFISRNRIALGVAAVTILLTGAGFGRAYWEAKQAARRFNQVRGLARSLLFEIHDEVSKVPGTLESRKLILARALQYLDQLAGDATAEPGLQKDLAESYIKVGQVQGAMVRSEESQGRFADARASYAKAVSILERLHADNAKDRDLRISLARATDRMADACGQLRDYACTQQAYQRVLGLYAADAKLNPGDAMAQARWLTTRITLQNAGIDKLQFEPARQELRAVATAFEALWKRFPQDVKIRPFVAYSFKRLGALEAKLGSYEEGIAWYRKAAEIHREMKDRTGESTCEVDIAWALEKQNKFPEAMEALDRALAIRRQLAKGRGLDHHSNYSLASALFRKAGVMQRTGRWQEGDALIEEVFGLLLPVLKDAKQNPSASALLGYTYLASGESLWERQKKREAKLAYGKGLELLDKAAPGTKGDEDVVRIRQRMGML